MDASVCQWIHEKPRLSNEIYESMKHIAEFKEDMHFVCIRAHKDLDHIWTSLPFVAINEAIDVVLDTWSPIWHGLEEIGCNEATIRKQKKEAKCTKQQKRNEQHAVEVREAREAAQTAVGKEPLVGIASTKEKSSQKAPTKMVVEEPPTTTTDAPLK